MPTLYSYVVDHDLGNAPCAEGKWCTLVNCKFSRDGRVKNIVERAKVGDWIVGTGGRSKKSSGHGTIIYVMEVSKVMSREEYFHEKQFRDRTDYPKAVPQLDSSRKLQRRALIADKFVYFGHKAVPIPAQWMEPGQRLEKRGPRHRTFTGTFVDEFVLWFSKLEQRGIIGQPCGKLNENCPSSCDQTEHQEL